MVIFKGMKTMAYTVKKLADISGVSVRTLHFYDEMGLLEPAYHGANGYRFYEQEQLLILQQILFYRELGFELKQIKKILGRSNFDKIAALKSHRRVLEKNLARTTELIETIDKTIEKLKGKRKMKDQELYWGFDSAQQAEHEKYLIDRFGDKMKQSIAESRKKVKNWSKADWEMKGKDFDEIATQLAKLQRANARADSREVQETIRRHFEWLKNFWTPNKESYPGHAQLILTSDLRKAYEKYDMKLPEFMAEAMTIFAEKAL